MASIQAPLERHDGLSYNGVHRRLGELLMEKVGLVLNGDRLSEAISSVVEIREHDIPKLRARDHHELAKVWGLHQYCQVLEATLRAYRYRTESRVAFIREDVRDLWLLDYFPVSSSWMDETHPPLEEILGLLPGAVHTQLTLTDLEDASLAALASHPELILDPAWRRQTSYFERLARDHPDELAGGLERLRHDLAANRRPTRPGRGSLVAWEKPGRPDHAR